MRKNSHVWAIALATSGALAGCSSTARYVTAKHWSTDDVFYVGYAEYTETNYVVTSSGDSSTHVMKCQVGEANAVTCAPQVAVDRLLNPDEDYPAADPTPAAPAAESAPAPEEPASAPAPSAAEVSTEEATPTDAPPSEVPVEEPAAPAAPAPSGQP